MKSKGDVLVVDCSVVAKWVLPEPSRAAAVRLMERYQSGEIMLLAPELLLVEGASLLAKRHRRKQLSIQQTRDAFRFLLDFAPRLIELRPRLSRALELSLQSGLSLWDCVYVAVAIEHRCPLITADRRLHMGAAKRYSFVQLLEEGRPGDKDIFRHE